MTMAEWMDFRFGGKGALNNRRIHNEQMQILSNELLQHVDKDEEGVNFIYIY